MTDRRALWGLVAASAVLRLAWGTSLGVGNDEAYHYLFTLHRDWSYYDHPPMMAVVEGLGLAAAGGAVSPLALRLGFVALFAGSTLVLARLTGRSFGPRAGVLAAVALNATAYYGVVASTFALPDGPLVFFWLLTLDRLAVALAAPGRLGPWAVVGLAWGGALLSKYQAVLLPVGVLLFLVVEPEARPWLRRGGPYLALGLGLGLFAPVIAWNAAHGWASFAFQGGRALGGVRFRPDALAWFVLGPALYLLPWIWVFLVAALVRGVRRLGGGGTPAERFLLCQALPPLALFLPVACVRPVLPHWPLVAALGLLPLVGRDWAALPARRLRRRVAILSALPLAGMTLVAVHARWGLLQRPGPSPVGWLAPAWDPTLDTYGWDQVARDLRRRGLVDRPGTFLFTSKWFHSGHLAFALGGHGPVLCYSPGGAHGFAQWSRPAEWVGRDGILVVVGRNSTEPDMYDRWFERIEPLGGVEVTRGGAPVRTVWLYRCIRQVRAFPYDGPAPPSRGRLATGRAGAARRR